MTVADTGPYEPPLESGGFVSSTHGRVATGWSTPPGVLWRGWSDSEIGVVYDGLHARTHLLDGLACELLAQCRAAPASLAALQASRPEACDAERVLATVTALEVAGLLVRLPLHHDAVAAGHDS